MSVRSNCHRKSNQLNTEVAIFPLSVWRNSRSNLRSQSQRDKWLKISQFFQITVTEFNINSLTTTDSEADLLQKSLFSTSGWPRKSPNLAQPKSMGCIVTVVSKIYRSIVTNFNVNFKTASGNETNAVEKSLYLYFRFDEKVAQTYTAKVNEICHNSNFANLQVDSNEL